METSNNTSSSKASRINGLTPVIVIGAARSGTKFLRDIIASSEVCKAVPYDINYVWRHGNELYQHDAIPANACTKSISDYIQTRLVKLAKIRSKDPGQFLVEKTVSNALRVEFINRVLPNAKFIQIIRDGRDVVESTFRMWESPPQLGYLLSKLRYVPLSSARYAFWYLRNTILGKMRGQGGGYVWGVRYPGIYEDLQKCSILEVCAKQWTECVNRAMFALSQISSDRQLTIRYEVLVSEVATVKNLCNFLELPDNEAVLTCYRDSVRSDTRGKWQSVFNEEEVALIMELISKTLLRLGYI